MTINVPDPTRIVSLQKVSDAQDSVRVTIPSSILKRVVQELGITIDELADRYVLQIFVISVKDGFGCRFVKKEDVL